MKNTLWVVLTGVALVAAAIPANADTSPVNLITNPNFFVYDGTSYTAPYGGQFDAAVTGTTIPGWTVANGTNVDWIGSYWNAPKAGSLGTAPDGGGSVDLDGSDSPGEISQTVATTAGQTYTLSFYLSGNSDGPPPIKNLQVDINESAPVALPNGVYTSADSAAALQWDLVTIALTATGSSTTISFASTDSSDDGNDSANPGAISYGPVVAGVSLEATPEPGLYGILAAGLVGLAFFVRRRRSA